MLRTAAVRLLSRASARQISTSSPLFVRIRSSNPSGGTSNPNPTTPPTNSQPSPAEAPPSPPPETTDPRPFTPEVHQASPTSSTQTQTDPNPVTGTSAAAPGESNTPLTPPAAEEVELDVQEPKDGKYTLPSLDIDPEVALPEPTKSQEGAGGNRRTGAGRKEYVSSIERQRKMWTRMGLGVATVGAIGAAWYASQGEVSQALPGLDTTCNSAEAEQM